MRAQSDERTREDRTSHHLLGRANGGHPIDCLSSARARARRLAGARSTVHVTLTGTVIPGLFSLAAAQCHHCVMCTTTAGFVACRARSTDLARLARSPLVMRTPAQQQHTHTHTPITRYIPSSNRTRSAPDDVRRQQH
ncbi:hypothetical protein GY45DRAFT_993014 [Cubamyces sp. BRFM 1775]|nr:hypothetical protein GY45DRAFT_993014 [Cubamyces sp. BRFM 1775]